MSGAAYTIDIEPSVGNTFVPTAFGHVWEQAEHARQAGKSLLWFNSRVWIVTATSAYETSANSNTLPADLVARFDDIYYGRAAS